MTSAADAARARRKLTNRLIAAHDAGRTEDRLAASGDGFRRSR